MEREELGAWLRLLMTPGVGPVHGRALLARFGLPPAIFKQDLGALGEAVPRALAQALLRPPPDWTRQWEAHWAWLQASPAHHAWSLGDVAYPPELLHLPDPPLLLFALGHEAALAHPLRVAVVGSRNPSPQGLFNARQFGRSLGEAGACVVSGLALGVDGAAHEGALEARAWTVAVVGTGLDRVYPSRHQALARRIAELGIIVSEHPLDTPPLAAHFPRRNRLIAALGQGTLVVEAALQSGSLITARLAAELGREVFAIPGSIHAPHARGCHQLIRHGAKLVESAQDVLEELRWDAPPAQAMAAAQVADPVDEPDLLRALGHEPVDFETLLARSGLDAAALQAGLLDLELSGWVARLPGALFQRLSA